MANHEYKTLSEDAIKYLCGLIRDLASVSEGIDDLNLRTDGTFSSVKIDALLNTLKTDCNEYTDRLVANLSRLELKIATSESEITQPNTMYLYKPSGSTSYEQYVVIEGTKVLLGTTDINMGDYYTIAQADAKFVLKTDFNALVDKVSAIEDEIGTEILTTTSTTIKGAINEVADKSEIVTLTKAEYEALADKDAETYYITTDDMTMYKGESQVLGGKSLVGKETVLYEGKITATGTYTLADDVNNYDLIVINHRQASGVNCESTTLSKYEISKCIDYEHKFMCVLGYGSSEDCISGYFNNDKLILSTYNNQNITSITGYKFGEVTVQNTITNPSPAASYSTDEQLTGGTWIDGKTIYRRSLEIQLDGEPQKTLEFVYQGITALEGGEDISIYINQITPGVNLSEWNIDTMVKVYGHITDYTDTTKTEKNVDIPYPVTFNSMAYVTGWYNYKTKLYVVRVGEQYANRSTAFLTFEYTKV